MELLFLLIDLLLRLLSPLKELAPAPWLVLLLDTMLKSLLLFGLALLILKAAPRLSAAQRHVVWSLFIVCALWLPLLFAVLPRRPVLPSASLPSKPAAPIARQAENPPANMAPRRAGGVEPGPAPVNEDFQYHTRPATTVTRVTVRPVTSPVSWLWIGGLMLAWLIGALAMKLHLFRDSWRMRRIARGAAPPVDNAWNNLLVNAARELGLRREVALRVTSAVEVPMVWHARQPVLLLPPDSEEWPEERRRIVLLHELGHIRRNDLRTQRWLHWAAILYWFYPPILRAIEQVRTERELACDDLVLQSGLAPSVYADHLLDIAKSIQQLAMPGCAIAMARRKTLDRRVRTLLRQAVNRRAAPRFAVFTAFTASLLLTACLAYVQFTPPPPVAYPDALHHRTIIASPDGKHVSFVTTIGGYEYMVVNGKPQRPYRAIRAYVSVNIMDQLLGYCFSPDGSRLAYVASQVVDPFGDDDWGHHGTGWWLNKPQVIVVDGRESATYSYISTPVFSKDSKRIAYIAKRRGGWYAVVDGREGRRYDDIDGDESWLDNSISFSEDSRHYTYKDRRDGKRYVIVDGRERGRIGDGETCALSPDFQRLVFTRHGETQYVRFEGRTFGPYDNAGQVSFSPDSRHIAWYARRGGYVELMVDGKIRERFETIRFDQYNYGPPIFSHDGRHLAYIRERKGRITLVIDGQSLGTSYPTANWGIQPGAFLPGGEFVYLAREQARDYATYMDNPYPLKEKLLVDDRVLAESMDNMYLRFSPDRRYFACIYQTNKDYAVVSNGDWMPDPMQYTREYPFMFGPWFSPSWKHQVTWEYQGFEIGNYTEHVYVDGKSLGRAARQLLTVNEVFETPPAFFFDGPERFHYFEANGRSIHRVEVTIEESEPKKDG